MATHCLRQMIGTVASADGDVTGFHSQSDAWLVKLDTAGTMVWNKCLGGSNGELGTSVLQATDGGYFVTAWAGLPDGDVTFTHGSFDMWVIKTTGAGNIAWQRSFGGSLGDIVNKGVQTDDGNFVLVASTASVDGDVTGFHGGSDVWVVKISNPADVSDIEKTLLTVSPNPVEDLVRIDLPGNTRSTQVRVCDMNGRLVKSATTSNQSVTISLGGLPAGCYTLDAYNEQLRITKLIVKR